MGSLPRSKRIYAMTRAMSPARDFTVFEGGGRWGVHCRVCRRFIGRQREMVLELNAGCDEHSTIICGSCVRRIVVMAGTMPEPLDADEL
jgi:hypothetical protein